MDLKLERPLVFFDLETTGTNPLQDRIVEISLIKVMPDGTEIEKSRRINPGIPIPEASTAVHHISDADVANEPRFSQIAQSLNEMLEGCDIAGYNSNKFDVPLLMEEFARAGINFTTQNRRFVDVQNIFYAMEPRTLIGAYRFYCGKELDGAHAASNDTRATLEVLKGQLDRYPELENNVEALSRIGQRRTLDLAGRVALDDKGEPVFNFGKYKGRKVSEVFEKDQSYYCWIMSGEFAKDTKDVIRGLHYKYQKKS